MIDTRLGIAGACAAGIVAVVAAAFAADRGLEAKVDAQARERVRALSVLFEMTRDGAFSASDLNATVPFGDKRIGLESLSAGGELYVTVNGLSLAECGALEAVLRGPRDQTYRPVQAIMINGSDTIDHARYNDAHCLSDVRRTILPGMGFRSGAREGRNVVIFGMGKMKVSTGGRFSMPQSRLDLARDGLPDIKIQDGPSISIEVTQ